MTRCVVVGSRCLFSPNPNRLPDEMSRLFLRMWTLWLSRCIRDASLRCVQMGKKSNYFHLQLSESGKNLMLNFWLQTKLGIKICFWMPTIKINALFECARCPFWDKFVLGFRRGCLQVMSWFWNFVVCTKKIIIFV